MSEPQTFTVHDIIAAEYNLEPLRCLHCGSLEVVFNQAVMDAYCADCGRWQLEDGKDEGVETNHLIVPRDHLTNIVVRLGKGDLANPSAHLKAMLKLCPSVNRDLAEAAPKLLAALEEAATRFDMIAKEIETPTAGIWRDAEAVREFAEFARQVAREAKGEEPTPDPLSHLAHFSQLSPRR